MKKIAISFIALAILLTSSFFLKYSTQEAKAVPEYCSSACDSSTSCDHVCWDDEIGISTTCGDWGICEIPTITPTPTPTYTPTPVPVGCWTLDFSASIPFPNPAGSESNVKERMTLLVLGDDYQMYPATIRAKVYNAAGNPVYERTQVYNSSPYEFDMVVWPAGNKTSGNYKIYTRAETSICGNSDWTVRSVVILD